MRPDSATARAPLTRLVIAMPDATPIRWFALLGCALLPLAAGSTPARADRLPHPVAADGILIGGSVRGQWQDTSALAQAHAAAAERSLMAPGDGCVQVGPDWVTPGQPFRLYGFDRALGECPATAVTACFSPASGELLTRLTLADCPVTDFRVAVAGPWDALPRRPRRLDNTIPFVPLVRRVLDAADLPAAPVAINAVHAVDLEGDGVGGYVINAANGNGEDGAPTDYSVLLLAHGADEPAPTVIEAWYPGPGAEPFNTWEPFCADADGDGDGAMELFVAWQYYEGGGLRAYQIQDGVPRETPLQWFDGL